MHTLFSAHPSISPRPPLCFPFLHCTDVALSISQFVRRSLLVVVPLPTTQHLCAPALRMLTIPPPIIAIYRRLLTHRVRILNPCGYKKPNPRNITCGIALERLSFQQISVIPTIYYCSWRHRRCGYCVNFAAKWGGPC